MAIALFITRTDLVRNSILDGNVDTDKFIQFIKIAQEIHVKNYLGSKLYNKISADIVAGNAIRRLSRLSKQLRSAYAYSLCYGGLFAFCCLLY
jgi:hypothetical protein